MKLTKKHFAILRRLLDHSSDDFVELARVAGLRLDKDFRHADLRGVDFGTASTTGWDFSGSNLSYADFSRTRGTLPLAAGANTRDTKYRARAAKRVFISYVRENAPMADRLAEALKVNGISVWMDRHNIAPGTTGAKPFVWQSNNVVFS